MAHFVAPPPDRRPRIPVITMQDLADALRLFLPHIGDFNFWRVEMTSDRSMLNTTITFHQQPTTEGKPAPIVEVWIDGKAARTASAKLWNTPFSVGVKWCGPEPPHWLWIEPLEGRAIAIHRIAEWVDGQPILAAPA